MTAKSTWGLVIAGVLGLGALIGPPLADSLVKEGKLPDWISEKLAVWLAFEISIPAWSLGPILVCIAVVWALLFRFLPRAKEEDDSHAPASFLLTEANRRCIVLQLENADLGVVKAQLQNQVQQLHEKLQARKPVEVSDIGFQVMGVIARCADRNVRPTLSTIATAVQVGHVETHVAIDVLIGHGFLKSAASADGPWFGFTPAGRAFYVNQLEQQRQA